MALIRFIKGLSPGKTCILKDSSCVLGRGLDCEIVLDIAAVSRKHARIFQHGNDYYLEDLKSRNGTYLDEKLISEPVKLENGERIRICNVVMAFCADGHENDVIEDEGDFQAQVVDDTEDHSSYMATFDMLHNKNHVGLSATVKAEDKLKALLEIGRQLGEAVTLEEVLLRILESLFGIFPQADRGIIVLRDARTGRLLPKALKQRNPDTEEVRLSRTILQNVISSGKAVLSTDAANDSRFDMAQSIVVSPIRSMMCAPMIGTSGEAIGVIQIDSATTLRPFTPGDLEILASVATQATMAVKNAQLAETAAEEASMRRELMVAHKVQQGFLPAVKPTLPGYDFFDYYAPARHLGGDYFDYIPLPDGRLAVALADVSGKGVSAALLMAKLSAETRYLLVTEPTLEEAVFKLNNVFCDERWDDRFVTLIVGVINPESHVIELVNAGHVLPMIYRPEGECLELGTTCGLPVGVLNDSAYQKSELTLQPGESLFFFTDGVTDAVNEQGEMFGAQRVFRCWSRAYDSVEKAGTALIRDIQRFVGSVSNADDICITGIHRIL